MFYSNIPFYKAKSSVRTGSYSYTIDMKISAEILAYTYPVARSVFNLGGSGWEGGLVFTIH